MSEALTEDAGFPIAPRQMVIGLLCAVLSLAAIGALLRFGLGPARSGMETGFDSDQPPISRITYLAVEVFSYGWIFFLGATIASFLNVVAWRMPMGLEVVKTPSHCPVCRQPIAAFDNVPIVGWLRLRGQCRKCGVRISPRYVLVELFFGLVALALAAIELFSGGANLPSLDSSPPTPYVGPIFILWSGNWDSIGRFLFHATLLAYALVISLIHWDDEFAPPRLWIGALAVGLIAPVIWPSLRPISSWSSTERWAIATSWQAALEGVGGLLAGLGVGGLLGLAKTDQPPTRRDRIGECLLCGMVGGYLGWRIVPIFAVVTALLAMLAASAIRMLAREGRRWPPVAMFASVAACCGLFWWRDLDRIRCLPDTEHGFLAQAALCTTAAVLFLTAGSRLWRNAANSVA